MPKAVMPSLACSSGYSGVARFAPTSSVKITTPAITSRAVVEASQPQRPAVAGRMRSSLKTVITVPLHEAARGSCGGGIAAGKIGYL